MVIFGAKGFAKEIIETILDINPSEDICFYDIAPHEKKLLFDKFPILTTQAEVLNYFTTKDNRFVMGIANPQLKKKLVEEFETLGGKFHTVIDPKVSIGHFKNTIHNGCAILKNAVIENSNTLGKGVLVHVGAFVSHDVSIGDYTEISPYVKLLGNVKIGNEVRIGTGAIILPGIKVGDNAIVGAGSVVTKDVAANTTVVGVPAMLLKK